MTSTELPVARIAFCLPRRLAIRRSRPFRKRPVRGSGGTMLPNVPASHGCPAAALGLGLAGRLVDLGQNLAHHTRWAWEGSDPCRWRPRRSALGRRWRRPGDLTELGHLAGERGGRLGDRGVEGGELLAEPVDVSSIIGRIAAWWSVKNPRSALQVGKLGAHLALASVPAPSVRAARLPVPPVSPAPTLRRCR